MDTEILTPKSDVDEYKTPHDCLEIENVCQSVICESESNYGPNESQDPNALSLTSQNISTSVDEKVTSEEIKNEIQNTKLEERLKELKNQMMSLKEQLIEEKVAWQKELEEATNAAKVVSVIYNNEQQAPISYGSCMELVPTCSDNDIESLASEPTLSELTILDYEQKLATYQDALAKAQFEKRNMFKRQLAVNAYKRRLLEVENLCNMELIKVKQSVQYLQPLQAMASSWDNEAENIMKFDDEITGNVSKTQNEAKLPLQSGDESNKSDFMTVEDFENTVFKDLKEFSSQIAATPCLNLNEADDFAKTTLMANWYNNELGHHSPFNPLM